MMIFDTSPAKNRGKRSTARSATLHPLQQTAAVISGKRYTREHQSGAFVDPVDNKLIFEVSEKFSRF
jgi:hypothetical protein